MTEERRINVRVSPELFKQLNQKRVAEDTTWQDLGLRFLSAWLLEDEPTAPAAAYSYASANRGLHDKLEAILNSGDAKILGAVVPNIENFSRLHEKARRAPQNWRVIDKSGGREVRAYFARVEIHQNGIDAFVYEPGDDPDKRGADHTGSVHDVADAIELLAGIFRFVGQCGNRLLQLADSLLHFHDRLQGEIVVATGIGRRDCRCEAAGCSLFCARFPSEFTHFSQPSESPFSPQSSPRSVRWRVR